MYIYTYIKYLETILYFVNIYCSHNCLVAQHDELLCDLFCCMTRSRHVVGESVCEREEDEGVKSRRNVRTEKKTESNF